MTKTIKILVLAAAAALCCAATGRALPGPGGVHDVRQAPVSIRVLQSGVEIVNDSQADCDVMVYAITGQLMRHVTAAPGSTQIELAPGCYVVRVDGLSKRIIIK